MSIWYTIWDALPFEMLHWDFMKNALLALLLMAPLFGILSTMIVTGRMSFFSDALGHSAFTGIAIGIICGVAAPIWAAVGFSVVFALLFSFVRSRSNQAADTLIGVFSSSAVALGIFVATVGGGSFTRYNKYLIGDILSVTPGEIGMLALVLLAVIVFWIFYSNRLTLTAIHPQLASSRGIPVGLSQTLFTAAIAVVVTLSISSVGLLILNSLLVLPGASARNVARNLKQYHGFSVLFAFLAGVVGLTVSYYSGCSAGAAISLGLATKFGIPLQSGLVEALRSTIVFEPEFRNSDALRGIEDFSHLWLIWQFSEAVRQGWSPTVRPPRLGGNTRMGVFATRSPFRPNNLGLSSVRLLGVEQTRGFGTVLHVGGADLMDGTPIFDIKPYIPYGDCHPDATGGFTDTAGDFLLNVSFPPTLLSLLPEDKRDAAIGVLSHDPRPSYQRSPERVYGLSFAGYDIRFTVEENILTVKEVLKK